MTLTSAKKPLLSRMFAAAAMVLSVAAIGVHPGTAHAQANGKGTVTAAIVPNYPPFEYKDPASDKLMGFDVDLGEALAKHMGLTMKWQETTFDQMMSSVTTQRVDIILSGMTDTPPRRDSATFIDYIKSGPQFYTLTTNAAQFPNMAALCGKRVGTSRRTTWPADIATWSDTNCVKAGKPAVVVVGTDGSADARVQLRQGRIDAAVQGGETLPYQNTLEKGAYTAIGQPFQPGYTAIGIAKNNTALITAMKKAFGDILADGTYTQILKKWGLQEHAVPAVIVNSAS